MQQSGVTIDNVVTILHGKLFKTNGRTIAKLVLTWPETLSRPHTKFQNNVKWHPLDDEPLPQQEPE